MLVDPTNPSIMYAAGVAGGVWKSTDGGTSWNALMDSIANLAISSLAMDPQNHLVIYAGTGEGDYFPENCFLPILHAGTYAHTICAWMEAEMLERTPAVRQKKKSANLSVDSKLLDDAKRLNLNLSQVFEAGLDQAIRQKQREDWIKKNRSALDAYNDYVEKYGVFSDGLRSFW
jgi:post-segregation antitoxin (ccd killing protein)